MRWCLCAGCGALVTLAATLALQKGFPYRDLILLTAFAVTVMMLVVQGLGLRWLLERLAAPDDGTVARAVAGDRYGGDRDAGRGAARGGDGIMRRGCGRRPAAGGGENLAGLQREAAAAQRRQMLLLRSQGRSGDDAFHRVEEEIDLLDLTADARIEDLRAPEAAA